MEMEKIEEALKKCIPQLLIVAKQANYNFEVRFCQFWIRKEAVF
jgi:hypothetical protein